MVRVLFLALALVACDSASGERRDTWSGPRPVVLRPAAATIDTARLAVAYTRADSLPRLRSLLVQFRGDLVGERYYGGATSRSPANIKSASKSVISALVGIALERGDFDSTTQTLAALMPGESALADSLKRRITILDLLTMRAGLQSTSFDNYGSWVNSRNWVRNALARPMVELPGHAGGRMIYSTGSSHLLSAALTRASRMTTRRYAERHLFRPLGITSREWPTDPQGIYFGGNDMRLTPREMATFGALYLNRGRAPDGSRILDSAWIDSSWVPRTRSNWSDNEYGYGWWITRMRDRPVYFAWGYGGQYIFVIPSLHLVVVTTSDPEVRSRGGGHRDVIMGLLADDIIPAAEESSVEPAGGQ